MDSPSKSDDEDRDGLSSQIIDYYKKYAQNKQLPNYFCGSSVSYIPQIVVSSGEEVDNPQDTISKTLIGNHSQTDAYDDGDHNKPISPASSVTSNRKLEWDNGADIGYSGYQFKSVSLPILSVIDHSPEIKSDKSVLKSQIIAVISYTGTRTNTDESPELEEPTPSTSSQSRRQILSSSSSSQVISRKSTSSSSSGTSLEYFKRKIGSPDAESTPKLEYAETPHTKIERIPKMTRKIIKLCLTKPITVECLGGIKSTGSNKKIQTSCDEKSSKSIQTGDSLMEERVEILRNGENSKDNQSIIIINCDSNSISSNTHQTTNSDSVECDSFEYLNGENIEDKPNLSFKRIESKSGPNSSSETSKETPLLGELIAEAGENHPKSVIADVDKSIGLIQKLMKSKRYDPATKRRYIKKIVQRIVDSKYEEDDSQSTDKDLRNHKLDENVPWYPAELTSRRVLAANTKNDENNRKKRSIFTMNQPMSTAVANAPTTSQLCSSRSSYNSWKEDKTLSERLLERRIGQGDQLVDFAVKERMNQISWITNEIDHLSKLKNLLQKNCNHRGGRGIRKTTTVYMVSSKKYDSSTKSSSSNKSSGRNYVIETELGSSSTSNRQDFNDCDANRRGNDDKRRITGDIEVVSDERTTNIKIKARTNQNGADGALLTLKPPRLIGSGTYTTDRCYPCGMVKKPTPQQYSIDIPLNFGPTDGESDRICGESTQCRLGCRCKEKSTQSQQSKSSKNTQNSSDGIFRAQTSSGVAKSGRKPRFCYCEGVQTSQFDKNRGVQSDNEKSRVFLSEGMRTRENPKKSQETTSDRPRYCYCEGIQTSDDLPVQSQGINPGLLDTRESKISGRSLDMEKPRFCYCKGGQVGRNLPKLSENSRDKGKLHFCYCEGNQTPSGDVLKPSQPLEKDRVPLDDNKLRFCYCEGSQTQENVPKGVQTKEPAIELARKTQSLEGLPKISKTQSAQSDQVQIPSTSQGIQLDGQSSENISRFGSLDQGVQLDRQTGPSSGNVNVNLGIRDGGGGATLLSNEFVGVALKECLCYLKNAKNRCVCLDGATQSDVPPKKCVCSEPVQTDKPSLVNDKLQTNRINTGDEKNQTYGLNTVDDKLLQTISPDIDDEKTQTDAAKMADSKRQTDGQEMRDEKLKTDLINVIDKNVQLEQQSGEPAGVQTDREQTESQSERTPTISSSSSTSSSWDSSPTSSSLRSCSCCKRRNVKSHVLASLRQKLSDQNQPLCKPCYRHYRKLPRINTTNFYSPQHVCQCYTMVQTNTLDEIKRTIEQLDELDHHCTCVNTKQNRRDDNSDYCQYCKCKLKKTSKSKSGIAYVLTFENTPMKNGHNNEEKKRPLEEIKIKIPVIPKKKKDRENKKRRRKTSESGSSHGSHLQTITLQEHLIQNRPKFVEEAEERRKTVFDSMKLREEDKDERKLLILQNNFHEKPRETAKSATNTTDANKRLFSAKEMKDITKKNYKKLPEVQQKLVDERERRIRQANRLIADTFNKKLRANVLKGKPSLPTDVYVVNV